MNTAQRTQRYPAASTAPVATGPWRRWSRWALAALLLAGLAAGVAWRRELNPAAIQAWVDQAGAAGPLLFMLAYALATVLFLPGSVLTLAGGALFGPAAGTLYNLTGATLGAAAAFLLARHLAGDWVARRTGGWLKQLMDGVENEGWRFVAFVRLVPLFPFNLLNYALGLTRIRFWHYVLASWVFMLPGAVAYTYAGYAGREALAGGGGLVQKALIALGLLATVAFLPRFIGRLRQGPVMTVDELRQRLDAGGDLLVLDVRAPEEFHGKLGHVAGALNVPLEKLPGNTVRLAEAMERPVAVICRTDRRSAKAARLLARIGFAEVHVVKGGMVEWNARGLPIER